MKFKALIIFVGFVTIAAVHSTQTTKRSWKSFFYPPYEEPAYPGMYNKK